MTYLSSLYSSSGTCGALLLNQAGAASVLEEPFDCQHGAFECLDGWSIRLERAPHTETSFGIPDDSLVGRGVLLRMGLGWFGGKIMRRAQERTRDKYDYRVMLNEDESTHSMRLPIEEYDVDENAGVGAWVLLEPDAMPVTQNQQVGVRRSGRTLTPNVRNIHQS